MREENYTGERTRIASERHPERGTSSACSTPHAHNPLEKSLAPNAFGAAAGRGRPVSPGLVEALSARSPRRFFDPSCAKSHVVEAPCFVGCTLSLEKTTGEADAHGAVGVREIILKAVNRIAEKAMVCQRAD